MKNLYNKEEHEHFMSEVSKFIKEHGDIGCRTLSAQFEVPVSTVNRWTDGIARPHPRLQKQILKAISEYKVGK